MLDARENFRRRAQTWCGPWLAGLALTACGFGHQSQTRLSSEAASTSRQGRAVEQAQFADLQLDWRFASAELRLTASTEPFDLIVQTQGGSWCWGLEDGEHYFAKEVLKLNTRADHCSLAIKAISSNQLGYFVAPTGQVLSVEEVGSSLFFAQPGAREGDGLAVVIDTSPFTETGSVDRKLSLTLHAVKNRSLNFRYAEEFLLDVEEPEEDDDGEDEVDQGSLPQATAEVELERDPKDILAVTIDGQFINAFGPVRYQLQGSTVLLSGDMHDGQKLRIEYR